ncbi:MAG: hypothetical protein LUQ17_01640 [Methanomicrobiales archaeon]|nr:hypothetical protein [Methanomicrobiales archaeon]
MNTRWVYFSSLLPSLVSLASAAEGDPSSLNSSLSMQDYFLIFLVGIVILNLFFFGLRGIFRRRAPERKRSALITVTGSLIAILFIAAGSFSFIIAILALLGAGAQVTVFGWLAEVLVYYTGYSLLIGILGAGGMGLGLFLLGAYILFNLQATPMDQRIGSPTRYGQPEKEDHDLKMEALNPTITLRIIHKNDDRAVANARVILKQTNGTKFFTKTTNIEGEVTFDGIPGYSSDYYAFVDGDENKEKYRVIRKLNS